MMRGDGDQLGLMAHPASSTLPAVQQEALLWAREEKAYRTLVRWWIVAVGLAAVILVLAATGLVTSKPGTVASGMSGFFTGMMACAGLILSVVRGFISSAKPTRPRHADSH